MGLVEQYLEAVTIRCIDWTCFNLFQNVETLIFLI